MPFYFGFLPKSARPVATSVNIGSETYEPAEPSRVKVFPMVAAHSILTSLYSTIIGLLVIVLSYPYSTHLPLTAAGGMPEKSISPLPFRMIGLAFSLKKGFVMDQTTETDLNARGFSTMKFNRRTLYFKNPAGRDDFNWVEEHVPMVDEIHGHYRRNYSTDARPADYKTLPILEGSGLPGPVIVR
jgi:hypothetical protein